MASFAHRYRTFLSRHSDELRAMQEVVALLAMHSGVNPQDAEYIAARLEGVAKAADNIAASVEDMRDEEITEPVYTTHDDLPAPVQEHIPASVRSLTEAEISAIVDGRVSAAVEARVSAVVEARVSAALAAARPAGGVAQGGNAEAEASGSDTTPG